MPHLKKSLHFYVMFSYLEAATRHASCLGHPQSFLRAQWLFLLVLSVEVPNLSSLLQICAPTQPVTFAYDFIECKFCFPVTHMSCCSWNIKCHKRARGKDFREFRDQRCPAIREYAVEEVAGDQALQGLVKIGDQWKRWHVSSRKGGTDCAEGIY